MMDTATNARRPAAESNVGRTFVTTRTAAMMAIACTVSVALQIIRIVNRPVDVSAADQVSIVVMIGLIAMLGAIIWRSKHPKSDAAPGLRELNDRFLTAINTMSHGLTFFNAEGRLVIVNQRFFDMYGMTDADIRPGMLFVEFLGLGAKLGTRVDRPLINGPNIEGDSAPFMFRSHDGRSILVRRSTTPDGGWVSTHEDVTQQEQAAMIMVAARDAAEAASRAKSDFLAIMSHEIRTPMAGMMGMIHLLAETELDDEQQQLADTAEESARNLLTVVNDILDFSRLEAGQVTPEAINFNIESQIRSVAALLGPKAQSQGLALLTAYAPDMPELLRGDPSRISQILLNLVGNAIKFTETGLITIATSHRSLPDDAVELRIEVTDTGVGMPAQALASLFDPFTQADTSVSRKYGGTGLGLAICKRLCETMGGTIGVDSEPGYGSTFWFTVMCGIGEQMPEPVAPPLAPAITIDIDAPTVLVAEDNAIIRTLVSKLLARRGYQADLVCNGEEAVEAVQRRRYGLMLMDMQMPEMDGLTATRTIRGLSGPERDVPIIALTANALVGQREICLAAGMTGFLTKPIQPDALYEAIQRWGAGEPEPHQRGPQLVS